MDIFAKIKEIKYKPFLCRKLNTFNIKNLENALSKDATFILDINGKDRMAVSWWVSAKRTRSYPYVRVYDSLGYSGKRISIIPIFKDEGEGGDRDFLQWDTISLMSLLGIYVIIAYYDHAIASPRFRNKITNQRFNIDYIKSNIKNLLSYHSDALHWNLSQIDRIGDIGQKAIEAYNKISKKVGIEMHSKSSAQEKINNLKKNKVLFMKSSRILAERAQRREIITRQPRENLDGMKASLTIRNYLGGYYFFTVDEFRKDKLNIYIIEGKHTHNNNLPSLGDIKDGLLKMILFTNLEEIKVNGKKFTHIPILKLTTVPDFKLKSQVERLRLLRQEAETNGFKILINNKFLF